MTLDHETLSLLGQALETLDAGFSHLPEFTPRLDTAAMREALQALALKMQDNFPYQHPLYVGQMLKPPHPIARLAYSLAMFLNPNNHALDGGRATSALEKETVAQIAQMFGWERHLGHLCAGGTMANFEALWICRELQPGKAIAASALAHYTHSRLSAVLGVPFRSIPTDRYGHMNLHALEHALQKGDIGSVVVTLGTTAAGTVDPLPQILELRNRYPVRIHVDAAYGGYYTLASNLAAPARAAFDRIAEVDSIVIDPHKHGLQPYGCGCVLFRDPGVGRFYKHDSPYTYFSSAELHLGEISLECSRPGAAAAALWATQRMLPLVRDGIFAKSLDTCREAALALHAGIAKDPQFIPLMPPELDIVVWAIRAESAHAASAAARALFEAAAEQDLYLALASFPRAMFEGLAPVERWDLDQLMCLRACVMKPEHRDWVPELLARLQRAKQGER
jgi:glutamate/tyrosine decarboxylase-like PLP-dependent enzyme